MKENRHVKVVVLQDLLGICWKSLLFRLPPQVVHEATFEAAMEDDAQTLAVDPTDPTDRSSGSGLKEGPQYAMHPELIENWAVCSDRDS